MCLFIYFSPELTVSQVNNRHQSHDSEQNMVSTWHPWHRSSEWHISPSPHSPRMFMGPPQRSSGPLAQTLLLQASRASPKTQSSTGALSHSSLVKQGRQGAIILAGAGENCKERMASAIRAVQTRILDWKLGTRLALALASTTMERGFYREKRMYALAYLSFGCQFI